MRIDATGFVSAQSGSVASANAVIVRKLLAQDNQIRFFTKPSFVDPRKIDLTDEEARRLSVIDCTNQRTNALRAATCRVPLLNRFTGWADVRTYNKSLIARMRSKNVDSDRGDVTLWLGDYARGRVQGLPSISYLQGPPATDARSILRHRELIIRLAGRACYLKLRAYAAWRMGAGYPDLSLSDELIVGSEWSRSDLIDGRNYDPHRVHAIPYPIDLAQFHPSNCPRESTGPLRLMWLGRFVPRKRLDLFLNGLEMAIRGGCDVTALVIGSSGFVPNYERLLYEFPFRERLTHLAQVPRNDVPELMSKVDVMVQPSDDENFGSSVAEALACGIPVIVGATNGTGDYICQRSIRLVNDHPESLAEAIVKMAKKKADGEFRDCQPSREVAEQQFDIEIIAKKLTGILEAASTNSSR